MRQFGGFVVWGGRVLMGPIPLHVHVLWWQKNVGCAILVAWIHTNVLSIVWACVDQFGGL